MIPDKSKRVPVGTPAEATVGIVNVYNTSTPFPEGTKIKALRIYKLIPPPMGTQRASHQVGMQLPQGTDSLNIARAVLGTVPVEEDGSAFFTVPARVELFFQALDEKGMAVQSMRSGTYVHPGEHLTCVGCHEDKWKAPNLRTKPLAMQRPASKLEVEAGGAEPVNFHRLVRPVFENKCKSCHEKEDQKPDFSYASLEPYAFYFHADGGSNHMSWLHGGSRTIAGKFGAHWSRLYKDGYLSKSHYDVNLTKEELRRITLWLDTNSLEMPTFSLDKKVQEKARRGELVWPVLDVDPKNPQGIEQSRKSSFSIKSP